MCGRYVVTNPVLKTDRIIKSAIQVENNENYNAHPYQKLPVIKKYKNGNAPSTFKGKPLSGNGPICDLFQTSILGYISVAQSAPFWQPFSSSWRPFGSN